MDKAIKAILAEIVSNSYPEARVVLDNRDIDAVINLMTDKKLAKENTGAVWVGILTREQLCIIHIKGCKWSEGDGCEEPDYDQWRYDLEDSTCLDELEQKLRDLKAAS